jgi:hypothetical protein
MPGIGGRHILPVLVRLLSNGNPAVNRSEHDVCLCGNSRVSPLVDLAGVAH